jgi:hypothetical protein
MSVKMADVREPTDHPLAVEQHQRATLARVVEIAEARLPRH